MSVNRLSSKPIARLSRLNLARSNRGARSSSAAPKSFPERLQEQRRRIDGLESTCRRLGEAGEVIAKKCKEFTAPAGPLTVSRVVLEGLTLAGDKGSERVLAKTIGKLDKVESTLASVGMLVSGLTQAERLVKDAGYRANNRTFPETQNGWSFLQEILNDLHVGGEAAPEVRLNRTGNLWNLLQNSLQQCLLNPFVRSIERSTFDLPQVGALQERLNAVRTKVEVLNTYTEYENYVLNLDRRHRDFDRVDWGSPDYELYREAAETMAPIAAMVPRGLSPQEAGDEETQILLAAARRLEVKHIEKYGLP